jgi:hypothetical protein
MPELEPKNGTKHSNCHKQLRQMEEYTVWSYPYIVLQVLQPTATFHFRAHSNGIIFNTVLWCRLCFNIQTNTTAMHKKFLNGMNVNL